MADRGVDGFQQVTRARIASVTAAVRLALHDEVSAGDGDVQDGESGLTRLCGNVALEKEQGQGPRLAGDEANAAIERS
jgi:hypothetical protein